ncbi:hypothetical protein PR202_gn00344 [Eleusine coracana subsp. coracana]|uniref:Uncharacterized protein n=1 Tax=Eleusine coracana subsp. coracana TaxID=191504 RepID=A0AAV5FZA5_ELECO|nr:hypothetical protein PR202_gn00344 [Eleusine coracana subsp. coracana]
MYSIELFLTSVRCRQWGWCGRRWCSVPVPVLVALSCERSFWSVVVFGLAIESSGLFVACLLETRGEGHVGHTMENRRKTSATRSRPLCLLTMVCVRVQDAASML